MSARVFLAVVVAWAILLALAFISTNAAPAGLHPPFPSPDGGVRQVDVQAARDYPLRSGDSW